MGIMHTNEFEALADNPLYNWLEIHSLELIYNKMVDYGYDNLESL